MGRKPFHCATNGSPKNTKAGVFQLKAFEIMSPLVVLCWECQASGSRVGGQWCSWITTRRWSRCVGCAGRWMQRLKFSVQSKGLSSRLSCVFRKAVGLTMVHVDNKRIYGLWKGEMERIGPRARDADLWISIWEDLNNFQLK